MSSLEYEPSRGLIEYLKKEAKKLKLDKIPFQFAGETCLLYPETCNVKMQSNNSMTLLDFARKYKSGLKRLSEVITFYQMIM